MLAEVISCVMPVYNSDKYLRESIQSILRQTLTDFELIIINDGSTDKSSSIIEEFKMKDSRIHLINQRNKGIVAALNVGIDAAKGMYIARMDADDISYMDRFKVQYDFMQAHPEIVLLGGLVNLIDEDGRRLSMVPSTGNKHRMTDLTCFPPKVMTVVHPAAMMRTSAIKAIGKYRELYPHAEDYDMYMRIANVGRISYVDQVILDYRVHGSSISLSRLAEQEKNAALSELENVANFRHRSGSRVLRVSRESLEAYIMLRVLRREFGLGKSASFSEYWAVVRKIAVGSSQSEFYSSRRLLMILARCVYAGFK